ncbi:DUF4145 domain-containing protein [Lysinibacillus sp. NPDC093692]|uniref:DUF4145 domain-containing protein n=1 Tax=Lysinibacillus sp. NPDC093692 TaxID=3390578 RepID=UPI003D02C01E
MVNQFRNPKYEQPVFKCSKCNLVTSHKTSCVNESGTLTPIVNELSSTLDTFDKHLHQIFLSICNNCSSKSIWLRSRYGHELKIFPPVSTSDFPEPHSDMPDQVKKTYNEAGEIRMLSPRASAALSRLALEQLLTHLGYTDPTLYKKIESLIAHGNVDTYLAQSLEVVRNFGNSGAHAGEIQLEEDPSITNFLLELLNIIVDRLISHPKRTEKLYNSIPDNKRRSSPAQKVTK